MAQTSGTTNNSDLKYNIMHGNLLDSGDHSKLYLNAGVSRSENSEFYFLKLDYTHSESVPHIYPGDVLVITIDSIDLELEAYDVKPHHNRVISFYHIEKFDLIDLGNARNAKLKAFGGDQFVVANFSAQGIRNIQEFVKTNVYLEPIIVKPVSDKYWGFLGVGGGTSHNLWLGMHINKLKLNFLPKLSDFGAICFGYTQFKYEHIYYVFSPGQSYISSIETVEEPIWIVGAIYGITYPVNWLTSWNLEIGLVFQYYDFDKKKWEDEKRILDEFPGEGYRVVKGEPYSGATFGVLLQAGSFWGSINTFGAWTAGVSIPIKN